MGAKYTVMTSVVAMVTGGEEDDNMVLLERSDKKNCSNQNGVETKIK